MSTNLRTKRITAVVISVAALAIAIAGPAAASRDAKKAKPLVGTFKVEAGAESADSGSAVSVTGTYFRMVQSGGTVDDGPFVPNGDSTATDKTYTLLTPGSDDGLITGEYQPAPDPAFDATGNGLAADIFEPATFFGVGFAVSTNKTDPQTGATTKKPTVTVNGKKLSGDLSAIGVSYGNQSFNQGAPKPGDGEGVTTGPTGTYDPKTKKFTLEWSSQISGGAFDGFIGVWHLEGTFKKK